MKTNKNGVKLLAAVLAIAMVFVAGFTIIGYSDDSDAAETAIPGGVTELTSGQITASGTAVSGKVTDDLTITQSSTTNTDVTLYVVAGKTVTIDTTANLTITIYVANGDATKYDNENNIVITKVTAGKVSVTAESYSAAASKLTISNTSTDKATITTVTGTGNVGVGEGKLYTLNTQTLSGVNYGAVKTTANSSVRTFYPEGDAGNISISGTDAVGMKKGSANITVKYDDNATETKISLKDIVATTDLTITSAQTGPTIAGVYTAGSITVSSGVITTTNATAFTIPANNADKALNAYGTGSISDMTGTSATVKLSADVEGLGTLAGALYVYGNVASNESVVRAVSATNTVILVNADVTSLAITAEDANQKKYEWIVSASGSYTLTMPSSLTDGCELVIPTTLGGSITCVSGNFTSTITTVAATDIITVSSGAKLTLTAAANLTGKMNVYGELAGSITITVTSSNTNATARGEFRAFDGSVISNSLTISTDQTKKYPGIIEMASGTKTVSGQVMGNETYYQSQNVIVDGYYDVMNNSTVTVKGSLEIPEGSVVTITSGSTIEVIGSTSVVVIAGKLIVEKGATFDVQNTAKSVSITGTVESEGILTFATSTAKIENGGTVKSFGTFTCTAITVGADSDLMIGGTTAASAVVITNLGNVVFDEASFGAAVTVSNVADGAVVKVVSYKAATANRLTINDANLKYNNQGVSESNNSFVFTTSRTVTPNTTTVGYSGFTVTSSVVLEGTNNTPVKKLDISGAIDIYNPDGATAYSEQSIALGGKTATVADKLTLGDNISVTSGVSNDVLTVSGSLIATATGSVVTATNGDITVTGEMTLKTAITATVNVNAAYYKATDANNVNTYVYTTLAKAVESGATDIKTYGDITVLDNVDIPKGTTVDANGNITIGDADNRNVIVKFVSGSNFKVSSGGTMTVMGTLEFENKKDNRATAITSDVSVIGDVSSKYTNIYTALANAGEGDVITITSQSPVVINADITVKEGVTLSVPAGRSVTVNDNVTVTVNGTVTAYSGFGAQTAFAVKEAADKSALVVNGKFMTGETGDVAAMYTKYQTNAAYYVVTGANGTYTYIAPVTVAAADAQDAGTVTLFGENKFDSVKFEATQNKNVTVAIATGAVVAGDIEISNYVTVNNLGRFDGKIASAIGEMQIVNMTGFTVKSLMNTDNSEILGVYKTPVKASAAIGAPAQKFVIASGVITVPGTNSDAFTASGANLSIAADATLNVTGEMAVNNMAVVGTLTVANGGSFTVNDYLEVVGTFTVVEADTVKGLAAGTASIPMMYVGATKKTTTGADATVTAPVIGSLVTAYVAAGATVSEDVLTALPKSTKFMVDGAEYMTVYTSGNISLSSMKYPVLDGAEVTSWQIEKGGKLVDVKDETVGSVSEVVAKIDTKVYAVGFLVDSGISDVYVDGNLIGTEGLSGTYGNLGTLVSAGTHEITYKLKAGFGGDVKITFNGKELTDGKFTISKDMDFVDSDGDPIVYKVVISGVEVSNNTPSKTNDDGMGITDYLLIVLVILAAILVVVVAIRMMRS